MKTIVLSNNKGGVGKTTCAINMAAAFRKLGREVLLVDLDPQANSSSFYGAAIEDTNTVYDLLLKACEPDDAIQSTEKGDIIPGDPALSEIDTKLAVTPGGITRLRRALKKLDDRYDICIIDTPPYIGIYMQLGLIAADYSIVPIDASKFAIDGIRGIFTETARIKEEVNEDIEVLGILLNKYDARTRLDKATAAKLVELKESGLPVLEGHICVDQTVENAQNENRDLFLHYPKSRAAVDFLVIAERIAEVI